MVIGLVYMDNTVCTFLMPVDCHHRISLLPALPFICSHLPNVAGVPPIKGSIAVHLHVAGWPSDFSLQTSCEAYPPLPHTREHGELAGTFPMASFCLNTAFCDFMSPKLSNPAT
jgi:hypothetical protein